MAETTHTTPHDPEPLAARAQSTPRADPAPAKPPATVSRRSITLGLCLVILVAALTPYNDYILHNSPFIGYHLPIGIMTLFLCIIGAWNPLISAVPARLRSATVGAAMTLLLFFLMQLTQLPLHTLRVLSSVIPPAAPLAGFLNDSTPWLLLFNLLVTAPLVAAAYAWRQTRKLIHALHTPLHPVELIVLLTMMLVGAAAPSSGLMRYLEPMLVTPYWHIRQFPWLRDVTNLLPSWLMPSTDSNSSLITEYWLGIDPVQGGHTPVVPFLIPSLLWGVLVAAIMGASLFLAAIFRRQWVHHERLTYPLATLPLELMSAPEAGRYYNTRWRNPLLWTGAAIPLFVYLLAGLHAQFPALPTIDLHFNMQEAFTDRPWNALPSHLYDSRLYFAAVGICFFIPSEVAFSLWLFVVVDGLARVFFAQTNFDPGLHENERSMGTYVTYFAGLVWLARRHLLHVVASAWNRAPRGEDEPVSYRTMLLGWLICMGVAWIWLIAVGMNWFIALLLLGIGTMMVTLMARIVAETGLFYVNVNFWPRDMFATLLGKSAWLNAKSYLWTEIMSGIFYADFRETLMPYAANSLRLGQEIGHDAGKTGGPDQRCKWFKWLAGALAVSILVSGLTNHLLSYRFGRTQMDDYHASVTVPHDALQNTFARESAAPSSIGPSWEHFGIGSASALFLMIGRVMWAGWPFHPIGLVLMNSSAMRDLWFSIFIGWGAKRLLLRYGGSGAFKRARAFFIGLIIGEVLAAGFWMFIGMATNGSVQYTILPK